MKIYRLFGCGFKNHISSSTLLKMKLTIVLLIAAFFQLKAEVHSQQITISQKGANLEEVFQQIMHQTHYDFIYLSQVVQQVKSVDIELSNASLKEALDNCFAGQPITYIINDDNKTVIVKLALRKITGKITTQKGEPLPGATISIKGKNKGTIANADGMYSIDATDSDTLVFSFIGYAKVFEAVGNRNVIDVKMQVDIERLDEVTIVSTGYQNIKKENVTGATTTISTKELQRKSVTSIANNLEATIPGLVSYYNKSTGKRNLTIRGIGSLNASTNALVVVDGLPIEGSIDEINPYDVESITVLKDAAAASIYGARASNGVIVVVTSKAKGKDKISVEVSSDITGFNKPDYSGYNYMTPSQQVDWEGNFYNWYFNSGSNGTLDEVVSSVASDIEAGYSITPIEYAYYQLAKGDITQQQLDDKLTSLKKNNFYEQYKEHALLNQITQQYNIALRTSGERSQSSLVVNYMSDNQGIINSYSNQLNISYKGTYKPAKWLDVNYGVNTIIGKSRYQKDYNATNAFSVPSYYSLFDENGQRDSYSLSDFNTYSSYNDVFASTSKMYSLKYNHLSELGRNFNNTSTRNNRYFVNLNMKIIDGLTLNPQFQYEDNSTDQSAYTEAESYNMRWLQNIYTTQTGTGTTADPYIYKNLLPEGGRLGTGRYKSPSYTARAQANYNKEFGKHFISLIAGSEFRQTRSFGTNGVLFGYDDQLQIESTTSMDINTLSNYNNVFWNSGAFPSWIEYPMYIDGFGVSTDTRHRYASGYANVTYSFDKRYNIFGSARKDYADLYGGAPKYRGRPLWSTGIAWNVSNEKFMENFKFVNSLKLRASYGVTGNISTNYTSFLTASISGSQNYTNLPIATISTPPNPKLRWEKTATTNLGLDFSLLDYRLRGSIDIYWKKGTDLFAKKLMDVTQGYTSLIVNNGDMKNHGVELNLSYEWIRPTKENGFSWASTIILSQNENVITKVDNTTTTPYAIAGSGAFVEGYPVHSLFSYQYKGLDAEGLPQYLLSDGTLTNGSVPDSDVKAVVFSGSMDPKVNISLNNELSFNGFSLSVFAVYYGGHFFRDRTISNYWGPSYGPMPNYILDSWSPTNTDTDIPGSGANWISLGQNSIQLTYADRWVKHADFIKIRNIVFGYELPKEIAQKIKATRVKVRLQVDNPKTLWTRDDLFNDPETGTLPFPTSYIFGVNVNF